MPILCENTIIFTASYLTKKWLVVIFESKSTRRREIKRLKCSSKQQQRWRGGEGEKAMRYGAKGRAVHPHNQVILATHRTLITTINDSPIPFDQSLCFSGRETNPPSCFFSWVADSSVRTRRTLRQSTVIEINDSAKEVSLLSPINRRVKSTFT